jgi:hypothetical protein
MLAESEFHGVWAEAFKQLMQKNADLEARIAHLENK